MQQPSLCYDFASKEELVHQIIEHFGIGADGVTPKVAMLPECVLDLPWPSSAREAPPRETRGPGPLVDGLIAPPWQKEKSARDAT